MGTALTTAEAHPRMPRLLKHLLISNNPAGCTMDLGRQAEAVVVEAVLHAVELWTDKATAWLKGKGQQQESRCLQEVDLQALEFQPPTVAQVLYNQSDIGKLLCDAAIVVIDVLPFCAPLAAVLGAVYMGADQAARNSANCAQLLELVKWCDEQLAAALEAIAQQQGAGKCVVGHTVYEQLLELARVLRRAGDFILRYSKRGWMLQMLLSSSDKAVFENLDKDIRRALEVGGVQSRCCAGPCVALVLLFLLCARDWCC